MPRYLAFSPNCVTQYKTLRTFGDRAREASGIFSSCFLFAPSPHTIVDLYYFCTAFPNVGPIRDEALFSVEYRSSAIVNVCLNFVSAD